MVNAASGILRCNNTGKMQGSRFFLFINKHNNEQQKGKINGKKLD